MVLAPLRPAPAAQRGGGHGSPATFLDGAASGITLAQCARLLTGLLWLGWANFWASYSASPYAALVGAAQTAAGIAIMAAALLVRSERGTRRLDALLLTGTVLMLAALGLDAGTATGYGTDELAYDQSAAAGLLHGVNPYTTDFTPTLSQFGVFGGGTMTLHGTVVPAIAYPSMSFLLYLPAVLLLGAHSYAGLVMDILAWLATGVLLHRLLSRGARPWVPLLLAVPVLLAPVVGGMTDSLFIPFELLAVCCWDRYGDPGERSVARWIGPVALGIACGIKQSPWLIAPFLAAGVALEAHRRGQDWRRVGGRYVAVAAGTFLIPNIPFIVWNPGAWVSHVLLPLTGGLVPMGVGPSGLLRAHSIGGGNLSLFGLASVAALVATFALYLRDHARLRVILPLLPLPMLFLSARSLGPYFAFCLPALAINAGSLRDLRGELAARVRRPLVVAGTVLGALAAAALVGALAWPSPTRVAVLSTHVGTTTLDATVTVENTSARAVTPHFILAKGAFYQQSMRVFGGALTLAPHSTTTVDVRADVGPLTPRGGDTYQVEVATTGPDTFSASPPVRIPQAG